MIGFRSAKDNGMCNITCFKMGYLQVPSIPTESTLSKKQERKAGTVSSEFVDEALSACEEHLSSMAHKDIDKDPDAPLYFSPEGWSTFLQRYYQIVQ